MKVITVSSNGSKEKGTLNYNYHIRMTPMSFLRQDDGIHYTHLHLD